MPIQNSSPRVQILPELGNTGLQQSSGIIREEFLQSLQWPKQNLIFREMSSNDSVISGILFAMEMLIRKVNWSVKDNGDKDGAVFLQTAMDDMEKSWADTINDILSFLTYGYSVHEVVYKKRLYKDGRWGWRRLPIRSQDTIYRWVFEGESVQEVGSTVVVSGRPFDKTSTDLKGVVQWDTQAGTQTYIPRDRFLLFRNNTKKDNPESVSILRGAYRPWFFKKNIEEIEAIGIERSLAGLPMATIPVNFMDANATDEEKHVYNTVKGIVTDVRANRQGGLVWPSAFDDKGNKLFDLKLLTCEGGSKVLDTNVVIQRYNANIAQSVLADFILLGQNSVGSFALSTNKIKLFHAAISSWLDSIASVFNKEAIPALWELNGWEINETIPTLSYGTIDNFSLEEIGKYFSELVDKGAIRPTEELQEWLLSKAEAPTESNTLLETVDESIAKIRGQSNNQGIAIQNIEGIANQGMSVSDVLDPTVLGDKELKPVPSETPPSDSPPNSPANR
jgi:hypothetical protein